MKTSFNISPGARLIHMYHNGVASSWVELPKYNYDYLFMTIQETPVTFTNGIPICPYCNKPTKRTRHETTKTALGKLSEYDEMGRLWQTLDPNTTSTVWSCGTCNKYYGVATRMNVSEYYECKQP